MVCETYRKPKQTAAERAEEIRKSVKALEKAIVAKLVKARVGPQGAIAFDGWTTDRAGVTDGCAYRRIMSTGSALARAEIAKAEQMAGRTVDKKVINQGTHSHDGGHTWHKGH